jgi:uncharacterized UPF0160 family protein
MIKIVNMDSKIEDVINQYVDILIYDIHIKNYELRKNKTDVQKADLIFEHYYNNKFSEFKSNIQKAKQIYSK